MTDHRSPRVNKALLANYTGQTVRLIGKIITVSRCVSQTDTVPLMHSIIQMKDDIALLEASDGGQVEVKLLKVSG